MAAAARSFSPSRWQADARRAVIDVAPNLFDRDLANVQPQAHRRLGASVVHLTPGAIEMAALADADEEWVGLLILDGLLLLDLDAGRARTGWLVGADDVIRPWDMAELSLTQGARWRALSPTRIALLDRDFSLRAGGLPILARALSAKMFRTANWLLAKSLLLASPVAEERLLLCFALLGERWGKVSRSGVLVQLPLTHALLAELCGVRRPSVTLGLRSLAESGLVTRVAADTWLLHRTCGEELARRPLCWSRYADALGLAAEG